MGEKQYGSLREKIAAEKQERQIRYTNFSLWLEEAHRAGMGAVSQANVVPMVVSEHSNPLDDNSPVKQSWFVADGPCGFAWVTVRPANSSFALWLKKFHGSDWKTVYGGGIQLWVSAFNQSMQKKEAYAAAYAGILQMHGINAYAGSRMD